VMKYFGSSGIRGIAGRELTTELAMLAGRSAGTLYSRILIARDTRVTGDMIAKAFVAGAMASGATVYDMGIAPTPVAGYLARHFECSAVITASHNPPEYNGIKMINPDGSGFSIKQMEEIEEYIEAKNFRNPGYAFVGNLVDAEHLGEEYVHAILSRFGKIKARVAVDTGNGAAGNFTPKILRMLGCKVLAINAQHDGTFPWRPSEPDESALVTLAANVVAEHCTAGIAHDGDADRLSVIAENGAFVESDRLLALFAGSAGAGKIVVSIDASSVVEKIAGRERVERTKTGDVFVSARLKEVQGVFGGEPSGTYIFPEFSYCPDGIYAGIKLLAMLEGNKISDLIEQIPKTCVRKGSITYQKERKSEIERRLFPALKEIATDFIEIDGIKMFLADGSALVRFSGTEPKIRISAESDNSERCEKIYRCIVDVVQRCIN